jgi:hypothetical protein
MPRNTIEIKVKTVTLNENGTRWYSGENRWDKCNAGVKWDFAVQSGTRGYY